MKLHAARYNGANLVLFISFGTTGLPALSPELNMEAAVFPKFAKFLPDPMVSDLASLYLPRSYPGCSDIGFVYTLNVQAYQWSMGRCKILFLLL